VKADIIDYAIAIVVKVIAQLSRTGMNGRVVVVAIHAIGIAVPIQVSKTLVGLTITVIIDAVADLGGWISRRARLRHSSIAGRHRSLACPDSACLQDHIINDAVAIVVKVIAQLRRTGVN
jgi:hypothetical protein